MLFEIGGFTCEVFHWIFHPFTSLICMGIPNKKKVL